jgi:hypothetical protein
MFKYFNPLWLIENFFTTRLEPATASLIGAGLGGGTSLLQGKSLGKSLQNAALGGVLGGAGGYLGGAMGGAGATPMNATGATGNIMGEIGGANLITGTTGAGSTLSSGLGVAPTFADRAGQFLYTLPSTTMDAIKTNPFPAANLGMNVYDRMNPSAAPLQASPTLTAQQLMGQQGPTPTPQFNSIAQLQRKPIYIG